MLHTITLRGMMKSDTSDRYYIGTFGKVRQNW